MFTRCPNCQAVHALNASVLAHAEGRVRCGICEHEFPALSFLFDHWPDSDSAPPTRNPDAGPPLLGGENREPVEASNPEPPLPGQPQAGPVKDEARSSTGVSRRTWLWVLSLVLLATAINIGWTFREPLLEIPKVKAFLVRIGLLEEQLAGPFRDLSKLHLVSRDLHRHPTRAGMLALSITFVNRAPQSQPYPNIEIILSDAANQPLARREFLPSEYLSEMAVVPAGLSPSVHVPVLLEFADPGTAATGFEINFR